MTTAITIPVQVQLGQSIQNLNQVNKKFDEMGLASRAMGRDFLRGAVVGGILGGSMSQLAHSMFASTDAGRALTSSVQHLIEKMLVPVTPSLISVLNYLEGDSLVAKIINLGLQVGVLAALVGGLVSVLAYANRTVGNLLLKIANMLGFIARLNAAVRVLNAAMLQGSGHVSILIRSFGRITQVTFPLAKAIFLVSEAVRVLALIIRGQSVPSMAVLLKSLQQIQTSLGGFTKAAQSAAAGLKVLANAGRGLNSVATSIGRVTTALIQLRSVIGPVAAALATVWDKAIAAAQRVQGVLRSVQRAIQTTAKIWKTATQGLANSIRPILTAWSAVRKAILGISSALLKVQVSIVQLRAVWTAAVQAMATALRTMISPVDAIVTAMTRIRTAMSAIVAGVTHLLTVWTAATNLMKATIQPIVTAWNKVRAALRLVQEALRLIVTGTARVQTAATATATAIQAVVQPIVKAWQLVQAAIRPVASAVRTIGVAMKPIATIWSTVVNAVRTGAGVLIQVFDTLQSKAGAVGAMFRVFGRIGAVVARVMRIAAGAITFLIEIILWQLSRIFGWEALEKNVAAPWRWLWGLVPEIVRVPVENMTEKLQTFGDTVRNAVFQTMVDQISPMWKAFWADLQLILNTDTGKMWESTQTWLKNILEHFKTRIDILKKSWRNLWAVFKQVFNTSTTALKTAWNKFFNAIKTKFITTMKSIETAWKTTWRVIKTVFSAASKPLQAAWDAMWTAMRITFTTVLGVVKTAWKTTWRVIKLVFDTFSAPLKVAWNTLWTAVKTTFTTVMGVLKSSWQTMWARIRALFDSFAEPFKTAWSTFWNSVKNIVVGIVESIISWVKKALAWLRKLPGRFLGRTSSDSNTDAQNPQTRSPVVSESQRLNELTTQTEPKAKTIVNIQVQAPGVYDTDGLASMLQEQLRGNSEIKSAVALIGSGAVA